MKQLRLSILFVMMLAMSLLPMVPAEENSNQIHPTPTCNANRPNWTMGVIFCTEDATEGYTLFSPMPSGTTYLIDQEGRFIHSWTSAGNHRPGLAAYLLPDGDLLRTANTAATAVGNFSGGGTSGKVERISWDGELEWSWEYDSENYISHHDIEPMPNGNVLMIAWEDKSEEEALQAGRNPAIASDSPGGANNVWPDHIIEVEPVGSDGGNIVWEWHFWDHLIQDFDETKDNYGVVEDHPELVNINYVGGTGDESGRSDWMHCNGIDYNPILDQIAISCKSMHEVYIIDHSTTTEEAAGHTGGNSGKGGDILYRWGNPQVYGKGQSSEQQLFSQHDVNWIEEGHPFAGGLSIFNNGAGRSSAYSSIEIIVPPMSNGSYTLEANGTFGPMTSNWTWNMGEAMYSPSISGVDAMHNGNVLVTHGTKGTLFEVNPDGEVVWTYIDPIGKNGPYTQFQTIPDGVNAGTTVNQIFKAKHIVPDHPALANRTLVPGPYLEKWTDSCPEEQAWGWDKDGDGCIDDTDGDGIHDPYDLCWIGDDAVDNDSDTIPDACDEFVDSDDDGIIDAVDTCPGFDDGVDVDQDGIPEPCDDFVDSDQDGVADEHDVCQGQDDRIDIDGDAIPDACDEVIDSDGDSVADEDDICPNGSDLEDDDEDGIPNDCDETPTGEIVENTTDDNGLDSNQTNDTSNTDIVDSASSGLSTSQITGLSLLVLSAIFLILQRKSSSQHPLTTETEGIHETQESDNSADERGLAEIHVEITSKE